MKRILLLAAVFTFASTALFAINPSARYETRMVYDPISTHMILFGGLTAVDPGTKKAYHLNDTWEWTGSRWIQRFPDHSPGVRSGHVMVYDSNRAQIVMFGGRSDTADLNDTWIYKNNDWAEVIAPNSPGARQLTGAAFDPIRDRLVIYGGIQTSADLKTLTPLYDTWEFDGTTWTQVGSDGPQLSKPLLAYDAARNQVIMLGTNKSAAVEMFVYDPAAAKWNQLTPPALPPCVNEGMLTYQGSNQTVVYTGGVCTNATGGDETYEWDGTTWKKITLTAAATRLFGAAIAFDDERQLTTMFGGTPVVGSPLADTWVYSTSAATWILISDSTRPGPRSLFAFNTDLVNNTILLYGGNDEFTTFSDMWKYENGTWNYVVADGTPVSCLTPNTAYDTDRNKLVLVCANSSTFEWDGSAWKAFSDLKTLPPFHRFASMSYDQTIKKTVLFGGYDGTSYLDQTWTWDGTSWNRVKNNPATSRLLSAMWYDSTLKKTVIYGGLGRITSTDRLTRYSDMWTFDGNGWTQLTPSTPTPGMRYGAQIMVDPRNNHLLLFGGIRVDSVPPVPPATTPTEVQVYADDMWEWDGSAWTQLHPAAVPPARENGRMAWDPTRNEIVMFGGYAGHFLSDVWTYDGNTWTARIFDPTGPRRRVAR